MNYLDLSPVEFIETRLSKLAAVAVDLVPAGFSVKITDKASGFAVWVDVEAFAGDLGYEWNMYIFHDTEADRWRKEFQDYTDSEGYAASFDVCTSLAVCYLEDEGYITQNNRGLWAVCDPVSYYFTPAVGIHAKDSKLFIKEVDELERKAGRWLETGHSVELYTKQEYDRATGDDWHRFAKSCGRGTRWYRDSAGYVVREFNRQGCYAQRVQYHAVDTSHMIESGGWLERNAILNAYKAQIRQEAGRVTLDWHWLDSADDSRFCRYDIERRAWI